MLFKTQVVKSLVQAETKVKESKGGALGRRKETGDFWDHSMLSYNFCKLCKLRTKLVLFTDSQSRPSTGGQHLCMIVVC
jgi:hypothetical protein